MAGPCEDLIPGVWNLRCVTAVVSSLARRVKQILSRKDRIGAAFPGEQPVNTTSKLIQVVRVNERLQQNLRVACAQEAAVRADKRSYLVNGGSSGGSRSSNSSSSS